VKSGTFTHRRGNASPISGLAYHDSLILLGTVHIALSGCDLGGPSLPPGGSPDGLRRLDRAPFHIVGVPPNYPKTISMGKGG
jgi:hypothetical protein